MPHIVVVDDDPSTLELFEMILVKQGHRVTLKRDGSSGLEVIHRDRPDLIILDLHLPQMDGFEVCRRIKADEAIRDIPVIMVSAAYIERGDSKKGLDLGAEEYIIKPFAPDILVYNVERLLGRQSEGP